MQKADLAASQHVARFGVGSDDLGIAADTKYCGTAGAVEYGQYTLVLILTGYDVDTILRNEVLLGSSCNGSRRATPVEQPGEPLKHLLLGPGAPFDSKGITAVAGKPSGKVTTHPSVTPLLGTTHQYLCTII